ncbi:protein ABHD14A-like isoform X2 [Cloeon dipterum]|uniref:protein ABHD14A-like isoform X2 n=1 Tax=Cloeon dipterum TaxID=197152 RepID=UPI0032206421
MKANNFFCLVLKTISVNLKYYTKALLLISFVSFGVWQTAKVMSNTSHRSTRGLYNWNVHDSFKTQLPPSSFEVAKGIKEKNDTINIDGVRVFYRECVPPPNIEPSQQTLLLLHGRSFTSETWSKIGTISLFAALGQRVIAVDLPGYGKTEGEHYKGDKGKFINMLVTALVMEKLVIISPSMSGSFSMPFLVTYPEKLSGFIPVAPTSTNTVSQESLARITVPTISIVGSDDDTGLAEQTNVNLEVMPNLAQVQIADARHAVYLNQPHLFHTAVYNFMLALRAEIESRVQ